MVTTNVGSLLNQSYKGSTIESDNVTLVGTEMVIQDKKVKRFTGSIKNSIGKSIGNFDYNNGDYSMTGMSNDYRCNISINDAEFASLQVEATTALLEGIADFENL